ncbi:DNA-binding response regulator [Erythrobacter colymbi]|uniref:response regulator transcription factor n=1 Tax=Erythrobacter colymbi TaxID=1161202 RepID=UPI000A39BF40|nr:DNA-binding response regulator [Erythrobacter colymbi]
MPHKDTILVVDDNPDSLRFLVDTLDAQNMTVLIARSGEATLELLGEVQPDLILMDAVMPGMSGIETTQAIKRNPATAHIPVIFITGLGDPDHVVAALGTGGVDYVRKPIVVEELLARIRVHLANARASSRARLALGLAGRSLAALDGAGALVWCTPQAEALFLRIDPAWTPDSGALPEGLAGALEGLLSAEPAQPGASVRASLRGIDIDLATVESERAGEVLIKLAEVREDGKVAALQKQGGLTRREAEVLLWVSYGKTNKTISEILGISPRTVNKHLEQVFRKLGVETRAAATAIAVRLMTD